MDCLNEALLRKQLWRLLVLPNLLLSKVLRQKYFSRVGLLLAISRPSDSYVWRSISEVIAMFASGLVNVEGVWVWKHSFSGLYTVKSGYNVAYQWRMSKEAGLREGSSWVSKEIIWNRLWNAKSLEGMKLLFWRVDFYNAIPVRLNLTKRGLVESLECAICGYAVECADHLFMGS